MKRTIYIVMFAVLLATFACYPRQESCLDKQIRLVNERIALHGYASFTCGE